eukprot:Nitzschia sp. Nitz4//scaffold317_size20466//13895//14484//NITZ4_008665-RA/size20466-snap-gene-0.0-mRNA-1//1//CDS//3329547542//2405//frame0
MFGYQTTAPPFLLGSNAVTEDLPLGSAFMIEFMGTFLLVWTVCMTAVNKASIASNIAPIAIGWAVLLAHLVCIPYTGCGINPARSFGPHFVVILAGEKVGVDGWWVYYTAPFVGVVFLTFPAGSLSMRIHDTNSGGVAALLYKLIFVMEEDSAKGSDDDSKNNVSNGGASEEDEVLHA